MPKASILTRLEIFQMIRPKIITQVIELDKSGYHFGMVYVPGSEHFTGLPSFRSFLTEEGLESDERIGLSSWRVKGTDEYIWQPKKDYRVFFAPPLRN